MSRAFINGVPLSGSTVYEWALQRGASPVQRTFEVTENTFNLIEGASELTLSFPDRGVAFERLNLLDVGPGRTPSHRTITVADCRWRWPDRPLASSFNVRQVSGDTFLLDAGRVEVAPVDNELQYAKYSLFPPEAPSEPWAPFQILEWALLKMPGVSRVRAVGPVRNIAVEVNDLTLFDPGHRGIERILQNAPGLALYLDYDGQTVVVYDTNDDGTELGWVSDIDKDTHTRTGTTVKVADRSRRRAVGVDVYFVPEIEHRFDYRDAGTRVRDTNTLTMVGSSPDPETVVGGRTVGRSTWVELSQLVESETWTNATPAGIPPLTFDKLREQYGGQWKFLEPEYVTTSGAYDAKWAGRFRAIRQAYRRRFQVDSIYRQRLAAVKATRVAILNYETGTRGPAEAYCDWIRRPSFLGLGSTAGSDPDQGWAISGYATDLDDAEVAPVAVRVVDPGAMVFDLAPVVDPYGFADAIMLGAPVGGQIPKQDIGRSNVGGEVLGNWDFVRVTPFELSLLVTVVPGSPNDLTRLHKESVDGPQGSYGPRVSLLAFPGLITAQFGWRDERSQQILDYVRGLGGQLDPEWLVNRKHVRDVAEAMATAYYESVRDTPAGSAEVGMRTDRFPTGQLASVVHRMNGGRLVTLLQWPGARQTVDAWRFLNGPTRRALLGVLEQGGTSASG